MSITVKDARNYFGVYLNNYTNTPNTATKQSPPVQVSTIPTDVTLETLIALTTYKPEVFQGTALQKYGQNTQIVQQATRNRLITENNLLVNNLDNFIPSNFSGNAIQRRRNGVLLPLDARGFLLRGLSPETQRAIRLLEDARRLIRARNDIDRAVKRIENQINRYAAIFNALVNLPGAIASAAITKLIDILTKLQTTYDALKRVAQLIASAYRVLRDKWVRFQERRKQAKEIEKKAEDIKDKLTKAPERPRIVLFPKFPKFPRLNWSKADFYQKYKKALENLKNKDGEFYKQAYKVAYDNAGFEELDPRGTPKINPFTGQVEKDRFGRVIYNRPDPIQRRLTDARNALRRARVNIETAQTIRTAAVEQARQQLIDNVRKTAATVEEGRKRAIQEYQNAVERRNQIGARKRYLSVSEQLTTNAAIDLNFKNIFGDTPTGEVSSDSKTVYTDQSSDENKGKKYVLVGSIVERAQTARTNVEDTVLRTAQRITSVTNSAINVANIVGSTAFNAISAVQNLSGSLNDKQITVDLVTGIIQSAQQTNAYAASVNNTATQQIQAQSQAEEAARRQAELNTQTQLEQAVTASIPVTTPSGIKYTPVQPAPLERIYRVVSDEVRFRSSPGLTSTYVNNLSTVTLNLVTPIFKREDGRLWGQFRRNDTGEVGWVANTLVLPAPGPFDEQGKLITN